MLRNRLAANLPGEADNELVQFFFGIMMLGGGIYWALNMFEVRWNWRFMQIGSFDLSAGVMLVPILIGIFLLFFMDKRLIGGIVTSLGVVVIIISMINSISFHPKNGSLYKYVLMFGLIFAGAGMLAKVLFKKQPPKNN